MHIINSYQILNTEKYNRIYIDRNIIFFSYPESERYRSERLGSSIVVDAIEFEWEEHAEESFKAIKDALCNGCRAILIEERHRGVGEGVMEISLEPVLVIEKHQ